MFFILLFIAFTITYVFVKTRLYGNESIFYVVGGYKPGIFGMFAFAVCCGIAETTNQVYWPYVIAFAVCAFATYVFNSPIVSVNGEEAFITTPNNQATFSRKEAKWNKESRFLHIEVGDSHFYIHPGSVNFSRLINWLKD